MISTTRRKLTWVVLAVAICFGMWQSYVLSVAQRARRDTEAMLLLAQEGSQSGLWYWVPIRGKPMSSQLDNYVFYGPVFRRMLGYQDSDFPPRLGSLLGVVHPDDMASLEAAVQLAMVTDGRVPFQTEYRLRHPDGSYHWYLAVGAVSRTPDGTWQMAGSITPADMLRSERQLMYALFDAAPAATVVCDEERKIIIFNTKAESLTGYNRRDVIGKPAEDVLLSDPTERKHHLDAYTRTSKELALNPIGGPVLRPHVAGKMLRADGTVVPVDVSLRSVRYGERLAFGAVLQPIETSQNLPGP